MSQSAVEAFGLTCDFNGKIIEILYDNLGIVDFVKPGIPFQNVLDEGSTQKASDFIKKSKTRMLYTTGN